MNTESASWLDKVRLSSGASQSQLSTSELDRRLSLSRYSSSYSSWTRPVAGQENTDSLGPASSILDREDCQDPNIAPDIFRHRRKSSADTCKDIDDIEDFELDAFTDSDFTDEDDKVFNSNFSVTFYQTLT